LIFFVKVCFEVKKSIEKNSYQNKEESIFYTKLA